MRFGKKFRAVEDVFERPSFKSVKSLKRAEESYNAGLSMGLVGTALTGIVTYKYFTSTGQADLKKAFETYKFPTKRAEVDYLDTSHPMHEFVNKAINHQAPNPGTQQLTLENGVFKLSEIPADRKRLDVEKLNTEIKADTTQAINAYNHDYYAGISAGIGMTLVGAFLIASARKSLNELYDRHVKQEPLPADSNVTYLKAAGAHTPETQP